MIADGNIKKTDRGLKITKIKTLANQNKVKTIAAEIKANDNPGMNLWINEYCAQMLFLS